MSAEKDYYQQSRPEVLALIPDGVIEVLDLGCGCGNLGRALKELRPEVAVRGIELMPGPAAEAAQSLNAVHIGTMEALMPKDWPRPDCIIFADVLEHLVDPWTVLRNWADLLLAGGTVVISLPNAAHHSALGGLLRGRWRYQDAGVLDRTHLRFFTRESGLELVSQAGLKVRKVERVLNYPFRGALRNLIRLGVRRMARREPFSGPSPGIMRFLLDFSTLQFIIVATKP